MKFYGFVYPIFFVFEIFLICFLWSRYQKASTFIDVTLEHYFSSLDTLRTKPVYVEIDTPDCFDLLSNIGPVIVDNGRGSTKLFILSPIAASVNISDFRLPLHSDHCGKFLLPGDAMNYENPINILLFPQILIILTVFKLILYYTIDTLYLFVRKL